MKINKKMKSNYKILIMLMAIFVILVSLVNAKNKEYKKATFGAGCFWSVQDAFMKLDGVKKTMVGYSGGEMENPSYEDVCTGRTGHAEVVEMIYDPNIISYENLLNVFWNIHNPTTLNRQGVDVGTQYRSVIFYHDDIQKHIAEEYKSKLEREKKYKKPIVTEIMEASIFYKAEEYHQEYLKKNCKSSCNN